MVPLLYLIPSLVFFIGLVLWLTSIKYRHLPGLGPPIIGNIYHTFKNLSISFNGLVWGTLANHDKYGDTIAYHYGPMVIVSTKDPILMEELAFHPQMGDKDPLFYKVVAGVFEGALSSLEANSKWKEDKKMLLTKLNKKHLELYHDIMARRSKELITKLANRKGEFNVHPWVGLVVGDICVDCFAGVSYNFLTNERLEFYNDFIRVVDILMENIVSLSLTASGGRVFKRMEALYGLIWKIARDVIESCTNSKLKLDYEPLLFNVAAKKTNPGPSDDNIIKHLTELLFESVYTTGISLNDAVLYLGVYPEYQRKVWEEQKVLFGDSLESPTFEDLNRMEYLDRFVKEAIRVSSPPITIKRSRSCIKTGETVIPNNATVLFHWDALRKDQRYWKDGIKFNPDHFLPEEVAKRPKYANYSFSAGTRSCPGFSFGINCCKVVLSHIVRNFEVSSPHTPQDLTYRPGLMTLLNVPHTISLKPRINTERTLS